MNLYYAQFGQGKDVGFYFFISLFFGILRATKLNLDFPHLSFWPLETSTLPPKQSQHQLKSLQGSNMIARMSIYISAELWVYIIGSERLHLDVMVSYLTISVCDLENEYLVMLVLGGLRIMSVAHMARIASRVATSPNERVNVSFVETIYRLVSSLERWLLPYGPG